MAAGVCYGRLDLPLSAEGLAAARRIARTLHGPLYTSPARRCRALADLVGPAIVDDRLQELDFGAWEGLPWDAIDRAALDAWAADPLGFAPPGGETGAALLARVAAFARTLPFGATAVTHGGPLRLLPALLRGEPPDLLAQAPPPGAVIQLSAVSAAASATAAQAPSTSPVKPPI